MKGRLNEEELLKMLCEGGQKANDAARYLLWETTLRAKVIAFVIKNGGQAHEAEDILIEGISQLWINVRNNKFDHKSSLYTYLFSICRFRWFECFREQRKQQVLKENYPIEEEVYLSPEEVYLLGERGQELDELLSELGENRKKLLSLWALGYSLKEIAAKTGYNNANVVAKTKTKCLKTLKNLVSAHPYWSDKTF